MSEMNLTHLWLTSCTHFIWLHGKFFYQLVTYHRWNLSVHKLLKTVMQQNYIPMKSSRKEINTMRRILMKYWIEHASICTLPALNQNLCPARNQTWDLSVKDIKHGKVSAEKGAPYQLYNTSIQVYTLWHLFTLSQYQINANI